MSIFVLSPLAKMISKENSKNVFWILFIIRATVLLICDFLVTPNIAMFDFFMVFIGAFIIVPISKASGIKNIIERNSEGQGEIPLKNVNKIEDNGQLIAVDYTYLSKSKNELLKNTVKYEIERQGEEERNFITNKLNLKRNVIILIFGLLTLVYTVMYFFNIEITKCLMYEGITFIIYLILIKKNNIVNILSKEAKRNPNKDIGQIITEAKFNKKENVFPLFMKTGIMIVLAIFTPIIIFANPRILYAKYDDGYEVIKYTRGIMQSGVNAVIPETYNGKNVLAIGENAFKNSNVKNVQLPSTLESIKANAFYGCVNIESIDIPNDVFEIRASAFENCVNLKKVSLSNEISAIRAAAFKNNISLKEIELPESLEYLGASVFSHCSSLEEITIPNKVVEINGQTFEYCVSLRKINLHDNIISIHGENFVGDVKLNNVVLPSKIKEIRGNTFEKCKSLTSIIIPEGVIRIGGHAFEDCENLQEVSIPSTILEIGSSAFRRCYSLQTIKIPAKAVINERAFKESPTTIKYY